MPDIVAEIFKKYGISAILFAVVFAFLVWGLAHFASASGTEVTVLWGLARYTKPGATRDNIALSTEAHPARSNEKPPVTLLDTSQYTPTRDITIIPHISAGQFDNTLASIRSQLGLRQLTALESGKMIIELPAGSYFFLASTYFGYCGRKTFESCLMNIVANRFRTTSWYFEIHSTISNGLYLVGFTSESDAARISQLSGKPLQDIVLSAIPWGSMNTLVTIPASRIQSCSTRDLEFSENEAHTVLDLRLR